MMNGSIVSLFRYPEKKVPAVSEQELILREGFGIAGDFHADGGNRQISLLTADGREWMRRQKEQGHCFKRYKENILLEGISLKNCKPGDLLICDDVILELTDSIKSCHLDICSLAASDIKCLLPDCVRFARVQKGGIIKKGMKVSIKEQKENVE